MTREDLESALARFHDSSFGWALLCCGFDRADAEDVLQSAYLKAMDGRARYNGHSSPRTWFFSVVRNTAVDHRRARSLRGAAVRRWMRGRPEPPPAPSPERLGDEDRLRARLRRLLGRLPARQREVIHLVFYHELSLAQAAEVLHLPVGTVRTHYQRGKARLRAMLAEDGHA
jgi:RNA polymerase sigma-70 factor (ECF subfamily)